MTHEWTVSTLKEELSKGKSLFILDIRNPDDFENNPLEIEGLTPKNVPYAEMLLKGDKEEVEEAIGFYTKENLASFLPKDTEILVMCYRGRTSSVVTSVLNKCGFKAFSLSGGITEWMNTYETTPLIETPELTIVQIYRRARGCLGYLMGSLGEAYLLDPTRHLNPYLDLAAPWKIKGVIDSHAHADHISGGRALAERLSVPYYLHPYDGIHPIDLLPATFSYEPIWKTTFTFGQKKLETLHIPGHTLGNLAFLLDKKYLFAGDSIFLDSIARPDLGGQAKTWAALHYHSLQELLKLPDETIVLPGHAQNSRPLALKTLGELKKTNVGLLLAQGSLEGFTDHILKNLPTFPAEYLEIKRINLGLATATDNQISKLEMGKNNCSI